MVTYLDNNSGFNGWNAMRQNQKKSKSGMGFWAWMILFFIVWWIAGSWFQSKRVQTAVQQPIAIEASVLENKQIDSDKISMDVRGLRISNVALKEYKQSAKSEDAVALLGGENNFIEIGFLSSDTVVPNINTKWKDDVQGMTWKNNSKIVFNRAISVKDYVIKISDNIKNNSGKEISLSPPNLISTGNAQTAWEPISIMLCTTQRI